MTETKTRPALKGGLGGSASGPLITVAEPSRTEASDIKLISKAVRHKWQVPELVMEKLPLHMAQIATDHNRDDRPRIAAAKVLVAMVAQNNAEPGDRTSQVNVGVVVNGVDLLD